MAFEFEGLDAARLRGVIADAEREEPALYAALGKKLFCAGGDSAECIAEMDAVRQCKEKAALAEALLTELESTKVVCASCGKLLRSGARFCSACGTPVGEKTEPAAPVCPMCGKTLRAGVLLCNGCGAKL